MPARARHLLWPLILAGWGATATAPAPASADAASMALDALPRIVAPTGPLRCPTIDLVSYRGTALRYARPLRAHRDFVPLLQRLDAIVVSVALRHYGRAPRRLVHLGGYNCRRIRGYPDYLSEHALGNAIDLAGFDFGPATGRGSTVARRDRPPDLPRPLRRSFVVRIDRHWHAKRESERVHARFLRDLASTLRAEPGLFRGRFGPGWPGHHNHFHFDRAPYAMDEGFED